VADFSDCIFKKSQNHKAKLLEKAKMFALVFGNNVYILQTLAIVLIGGETFCK
jgi:hypothetical protein